MDSYATDPPLLDLTDPRASDPSVTGPKAANLARARAAGLPVLDGVVLTTRGRPSPQALTEAWRVLSRDGTRPLVVRSSSVAEDGATSAMAGRFRSVLGVTGFEAFLGAVDEVLASAGDVGSDAAPMAVLVQPELGCACGGVMFGLDPGSGDTHRLLVEVVPGGPDGLVSGRVTASRLVLSRRGRRLSCDGGPGDLGHGHRRWLAGLARATGRCFGGPQDIEWAIDHDGTGWLLQSRPITAAASPPTGPVLGPGPVAETFPEPLSPLEADLWIEPMRRGIDAAIRLTGTRSGRQRRLSPIVTLVGGRAAADLELLGVHQAQAGFLRRLDPRPPARRLRCAWRVGRLRATLASAAEGLVTEVDRRLAAVPRLDGLTDQELLTVLRAARDDLAVVHTAEILAGMLLSPPTRTAPALASAAVSGIGGYGGDDEVVSRHPVALALVPARIGAPHPLPHLAGVGTAPSSVADLEAREALRLRTRWLQELSARAAGEIAHRLAAAARIERAARVSAYTLADLELLVAGGDPPDGSVILPGPPLPGAFRLTASGAVVAVSGPPTEGRGASPGRVVGTVHHGMEPDPPPPGAILVVATLDPRLAGILPGLGGLVAETGSTLSHLAILAREAGIPTVVAVPDALRRFPAGVRVLLDGTTGDVALVDSGTRLAVPKGAR